MFTTRLHFSNENCFVKTRQIC